jgi:chemotaxis protein MotB
MAAFARRSQRSTNIWPGFVDALATLLMVIIFLLMVFVLAQFFLNETISNRDEALVKLQDQVGELADLLALERRSNTDLRLNLSQLSEELQASVAMRDDLNVTLENLSIRAETAEDEARRLNQTLEDAFTTIQADKGKIEAQLGQLAALHNEVAALTALRDELENEIREKALALNKTEEELIEERKRANQRQELFVEERKISDTARAQVALLNRQMAALREQLKELSSILAASEHLAEEQEVQIASLGKRLNAALASKVQELSRYRSEFFGRLREVLGEQPGVRVVGDRFVFQSEVLFGSGSAEMAGEGMAQMAQLAATLREISANIPDEINWVMRVDGHTDKIPIATYQFPSNWELSTARAISVVKFLMEQGIPATRLAATGFGEHQPLDPRDDEIAYRRNRRIELKLTQR